MNDRRLIGAFTAAGAVYPPYVNISEEFDHTVTIHVRGPARPMTTNEGVYPVPGLEAEINLSREEFKTLFGEMQAAIERKPS